MSEMSESAPTLAPEETSAESGAKKKRGRRGFGKGDLHPFFSEAEVEEVDRSQVVEAAYNPRQIDINAKIKLRNGLEEFGSVEPLIWNRRSGHLVGGHQRLQIMDERAGHKEYKLHVSVVDLDDQKERELNLLLNNQGAQGWWDFPKMAQMIADMEEFNADLAGFDKVDLQRALNSYVPNLGEMDLTHVFGDLSADDAKGDADKIKAMKAEKAEYKAVGADVVNDQITLTLVFPRAENKVLFCQDVGVSPNTKYIDAIEFSRKLDIDCGHAAVPDPVLPNVGSGDSVDGPAGAGDQPLVPQ